MESQNKENKHLIKTIIKNEKFLRPSLVFLVFYIFIILQNWRSLLFLLIPLITYVTFVFFKGIDILKSRTQAQRFNVEFNPMGNEKLIASRLYFCLLLELVIVLAMGAESLYHPQLINNYFIYYVIPLVLIYIFSMYYSLYDLGFFAKIEITLKNEFYIDSKVDLGMNSSDRNIDSQNMDLTNTLNNGLNDENSIHREKELLTYLNLKKFKNISNIVRFSVIILSIGWLAFQALTIINFIPGIPFNIPGSVIPQGSPLYISFFVYICLIGIPIIMYFVVSRTYSIIAAVNLEELKRIISKFPENQQQNITRILKFHLDLGER